MFVTQESKNFGLVTSENTILYLHDKLFVFVFLERERERGGTLFVRFSYFSNET